MTNVGFSGTRLGMTAEQRNAVKAVISQLAPKEIHHGDCVGADAQVHAIAKELGVHIVVHPPTAGVLRAYCEGGEHLPPKDYIDRNHDIVDACEFLVAAPDVESFPPKKYGKHSGTLATVHYAYDQKKNVYVVDQRGRVSR